MHKIFPRITPSGTEQKRAEIETRFVQMASNAAAYALVRGTAVILGQSFPLVADTGGFILQQNQVAIRPQEFLTLVFTFNKDKTVTLELYDHRRDDEEARTMLLTIRRGTNNWVLEEARSEELRNALSPSLDAQEELIIGGLVVHLQSLV